ncbi:DotU family type IV/VI secretion system protein [Thermomonas paludicola]|uniref:DotU family type IV/VI secretion system protein n=1 Tax=Thermomonas paludicola TaxID=2884874 RepID=UPI0021145584|nr:DotU family type IV/VI secretion system protein [Thermomonas paludicola]
MARLLQHFSPVFSYGLALDEKVATNQASDTAVAVAARARELIERAKSVALADGKRPQMVDDATFAVVAWIDEIMARNPMWLTSGAVPLQVSMFTTNNAGNEFFAHLSALKQDQDEVREVYYHTLLCGFVGQYYYENGDTGELGKLKELHGRQLPVAPAQVHTLREEKITPQPYAVADPAGPRLPRQWDKTLLRIGALVALLIPVVYLVYILLAAPKPSITVPVQQVLAKFECSDLKPTVDEDSGIVKLSGYVSRPDDMASVKQQVAAIEGVKSVDAQLQLRIWPHCEVVKVLEAYKARNDDSGQHLAITPSTGHSDRFIEGENVIVKLQQPDYDGYLYVDYYTVNGGVAHIYPNAGEAGSGRLLKSLEQFEVGATPAKTWTVCAPFGQELITVIASPRPLYQDALPEIQTAQEYLPMLRKMLEANRGNSQLLAAHLFMQTEPETDPARKQQALAACQGPEDVAPQQEGAQ